MKKIMLSLVVLLAAAGIQAQSFSLVTDPTNPVVAESAYSERFSFAYTGCAWVDVNEDEWLDLFYSGRLYINQQNGNFRKYTGIGSQDSQSTTSCSWGDFNRDGHLDVLYSNNNKTSIYQGDGQGGLFILPTLLEDINTVCWSAQFTDFNNDSWLDLTLTFADGFHAGHYPVRLFSGSDRGLYPIADTLEFLNDFHPYTVSYFTDYDLDGDQDLFIASGPGGQAGMDFHYTNLLTETGEARFQKMTNQPWGKQTQDGQNYNFIDIDNDGDLDMCLTNWAGAPNRFFLNEDGTYQALSTPFTTGGVCLSNAWGDFDNDSYIDVIITSGGTGNQAGYYRNNGNGTFDFKGNIILDNIQGNSAGCTVGDYDNDGDLDFFTVGMEKGLFKNDLPDHNAWINIALTGVESNAAAIGAKVRVKATIRGKEVWQIREVSAQNTFMGHNSLRVHFGLSDATMVDSLVIYWPSGLEEVYTDVPVKAFYKYQEGDANSTSIGELFRPTSQLEMYPNPAGDYFNLTIDGSEHQKLVLRLIDMQGQVVLSRRLGRAQSYTIDTASLVNGLYQVQVLGDQVLDQQSLVIQK